MKNGSLMAMLAKVQRYHTSKANRHLKASTNQMLHEKESQKEREMAEAIRDAKDLIKKLSQECEKSRVTVTHHKKLVRAFERIVK